MGHPTTAHWCLGLAILRLGCPDLAADCRLNSLINHIDMHHSLNNIRHSITANRHTLTTFLHSTLNMTTIDNYKHTFTLSSNFHTGELKWPTGLAFFCRAQYPSNAKFYAVFNSVEKDKKSSRKNWHEPNTFMFRNKREKKNNFFCTFF